MLISRLVYWHTDGEFIFVCLQEFTKLVEDITTHELLILETLGMWSYLIAFPRQLVVDGVCFNWDSHTVCVTGHALPCPFLKLGCALIRIASEPCINVSYQLPDLPLLKCVSGSHCLCCRFRPECAACPPTRPHLHAASAR